MEKQQVIYKKEENSILTLPHVGLGISISYKVQVSVIEYRYTGYISLSIFLCVPILEDFPFFI